MFPLEDILVYPLEAVARSGGRNVAAIIGALPGGARFATGRSESFD
jgi:hypothetical protein